MNPVAAAVQASNSNGEATEGYTKDPGYAGDSEARSTSRQSILRQN